MMSDTMVLAPPATNTNADTTGITEPVGSASFAPRSHEDLSALAWVVGELKRAIEAAHKALRRYVKEADASNKGDLDAVDPAVLRTARSQLHQGVGALELVGQSAGADALRAAEALVQRFINRPAMANAAGVETVEKLSFALLDFLNRQLAGKAVSPVMLFPQVQAALQAAGSDRVHPADLWKTDWHWAALNITSSPNAPTATATTTARRFDEAARNDMEDLVLTLMREPGRGAHTRMSELCIELAAGAARTLGQENLATLWQMAAALYEALANGLLDNDLHVKRVASRLLAQLRMTVRGTAGASERLAQDLLFFCAHARPAAHTGLSPRLVPHLTAVRQAWQLEQKPTGDYSVARLGLFDPAAVTSAKKRVASAKDTWSAVADGEAHRMGAVVDQFALVGDSLQKLFPTGDRLAQALTSAALRTVAANAPPPAPLAMEVATAMLYLDAVLEDGELDQPELPGRVVHLASRIDAVCQGADPKPLDVWMEDLYRRVSDRQTMGSVVQELRASLSEVEKQIDQYFRNPADRGVLIPVPAQLSAMRGVLSVLGLKQASAAALHMRDEVDALAQTEVDAQKAIEAGTFDRLADNLGALSFLIDMLSVQPRLAKSLFRFDADTGSLSAVMGQPERVSAFGGLDSRFDGEPTAPADAQSHANAEIAVTAGPTSAGGQPELLGRMQTLARAAARSDVSDEELVHQLEQLAPQALAADQPELARLLTQAQRTLRNSADPGSSRTLRAELVAAVQGLQGPEPEALPPPAPVPPPHVVAVAGGTGLEDDPEMREVFIEEAREVVEQATVALEELAQASGNDGSEMTTVRRAFHTLKGSARMVGLRDFGEAAWACEQLYNAKLAQSTALDAPLQRFTAQALAYLGVWVEAIAAGADTTAFHSAAVVGPADALRLHGQALDIAQPGAQLGAGAPGAAALPVALPAAVAAAVPVAVADSDTAAWPEPAAMPQPPTEVDVRLYAPIETSAATEPAVFTTTPLPADLRYSASPPPAALQQMVPGLPLATDLDLDRGTAATTPLPYVASPQPGMAAPAGRGLDFQFDLGDGQDPATLPLDAPTPPATVITTAVPELPSADMLELDLDDVPGFFEDEQPLPVALLEPSAPSANALTAPPSDEPPVSLLSLLENADASALLPAAAAAPAEDDNIKIVGPLRISIPLFNIFLNEADELSRRLATELAEWALEQDQEPVGESTVALAHSLAGNAATVGAAGLSGLARSLEHALMRSRAVGRGRTGEATLFSDTAEEIRRLLHQFAAGFLHEVPPELTQRLADHERWPVPPPTEADTLNGALAQAVAPHTPADTEAEPQPELQPEPDTRSTALQATAFAPLPDTAGASLTQPAFLPTLSPSMLGASNTAVSSTSLSDTRFSDEDDIDATDAIDAELFPIFEEEADELLPQLQARLRDWLAQPQDASRAASCMRTLHTFKGGARLAGAMRLGEMAHRLEAAVNERTALPDVQAADVEPLLARADSMAAALDALRAGGAVAAVAGPGAQNTAHAEPRLAAPAPLPVPLFEALAAAAAEDAVAAAQNTTDAATPAATPAVTAVPLPARAVDWSRFSEGPAPEPLALDRNANAGGAVRVRASLLDRLVNQAGEVSITRARIAGDVKQLQAALSDLTDSLERMRSQLRDLELQAETQISSRMEAAKASAAGFDPLEMDRFTRFQELTRFMAESVNDVATLQRSLQRTLQSTEDDLAAQARLTRDLQDDLLRTRMVEFESSADRLYRTARQAAKDSGKAVRLDIVGGAIELDRGVLDRMTGPFEHLVRNSVAHGIEAPEQRQRSGKPETGQVTITVTQAGNEVSVECADDGAGLDLQRVRERAVQRGLLAADAPASDADLSQLIFQPGFSTADHITELSGRGVGLDVVRAEVAAMGGRVETHSQPGQGTRFKLVLPLTTAVTQVVMLRSGSRVVAVPSTLVEVVRRVPSTDVHSSYASGQLNEADESLPFFWLASLLGPSAVPGDTEQALQGNTPGRSQAVAIIRSAAQRVAVHVDEVVGNQEVVVKNVGPQLARVPGLAGVTLLPSGAVALIYNPVALANVYGPQVRAQIHARSVLQAQSAGAANAEAAAVLPQRSPLVMVVDDSLTVRRVTQRLLQREGYRVVTAKDGKDALERLTQERPAVLLSDIEMPRMDGFDLLRNVRADATLAQLPVIMITSRSAQKHRDYAAELGVDHYLGKPYAEDELLGLVARYARIALPH
jgi:chemosensory pili system protein ChpA (sensor histidine kinase/response regulator)